MPASRGSCSWSWVSQMTATAAVHVPMSVCSQGCACSPPVGSRVAELEGRGSFPGNAAPVAPRNHPGPTTSLMSKACSLIHTTWGHLIPHKPCWGGQVAISEKPSCTTRSTYSCPVCNTRSPRQEIQELASPLVSPSSLRLQEPRVRFAHDGPG